MKKTFNTHKIKFLALGFSLLAFSTSWSQDVHFSQMEYSPLTLNPALAGANSSLQAIVNYRSQWRSVASPYNTIAASFDARLNEGKRNKKGYLALGVNFFNDQSGDARISSNTGAVNVAYHILLNRKSTLGAGIYGGFGQRSIDAGAGKWGSQYDGMMHNPTLPSGEFFFQDNFTYMDFGGGLVYTYKGSENYMTKNDQRELNAGVAVYHLNRPDYSFINTGDDNLYMRWSIFANGVIGIENTRWSFLPGVYYQRQKSAQELLVGTSVRYLILESSKITGYKKGGYFSLGAFYRNKDAFVARSMFEWSDYSVGFAYDVNLSTLTEVSNAKGGFEIFLRMNLTGDYLWTRARMR